MIPSTVFSAPTKAHSVPGPFLPHRNRGLPLPKGGREGFWTITQDGRCVCPSVSPSGKVIPTQARVLAQCLDMEQWTRTSGTLSLSEGPS